MARPLNRTKPAHMVDGADAARRNHGANGTAVIAHVHVHGGYYDTAKPPPHAPTPGTPTAWSAHSMSLPPACHASLHFPLEHVHGKRLIILSQQRPHAHRYRPWYRQQRQRLRGPRRQLVYRWSFAPSVHFCPECGQSPVTTPWLHNTLRSAGGINHLLLSFAWSTHTATPQQTFNVMGESPTTVIRVVNNQRYEPNQLQQRDCCKPTAPPSSPLLPKWGSMLPLLSPLHNILIIDE